MKLICEFQFQNRHHPSRLRSRVYLRVTREWAPCASRFSHYPDRRWTPYCDCQTHDLAQQLGYCILNMYYTYSISRWLSYSCSDSRQPFFSSAATGIHVLFTTRKVNATMSLMLVQWKTSFQSQLSELLRYLSEVSLPPIKRTAMTYIMPPIPFLGAAGFRGRKSLA